MSKHRIQKLLLAGSIACAVVFGAVIWAGHTVETESTKSVAGNLESLPRRHVALVLGCSPTTARGRVNPFFSNRMQAAAEAYKAQKVDYLLVSGDNHTKEYDEPTAMKNALIRLGVPEGRIVLDCAGFSTFDSIIRAKEVFGLSGFCIVTQRDHALRAIFIARRHNLDVVAYAAGDVGRGAGLRMRLRESLARVRAILDVTILSRKPHFLGPRIPIGEAPHQPASGNGAPAVLFHVGRLCRAVPELDCWAST